MGTKLRAFQDEAATPEEVDRLLELLQGALHDGALGIGMQLVGTPGARRDEIFRAFELGARSGATIFVHPRTTGETEPGSSLEAFQEILADAAASGASLHVLHVTSNGLRKTPAILSMVEGARKRGLDVSMEAYPYTTQAVPLTARMFAEGWQERLGISYSDLEVPITGEHVTETTFDKYRKERRLLIVHSIPDAIADAAMKNPLVMIASDGFPFETGTETPNPHGAGTFSRVLGVYVRERQILNLKEALRRMTLMPAQRLERFVPQMRKKGRIQVGADADLTVFDDATILDRASDQRPMQASAGIVHVLVSGTFVVRDGKPDNGVFPGRPIRNQRH